MDLKNLLHKLICLYFLFEYLRIAKLLFQLVLLLLLLSRSTNSVLSNIDLTKIFPICGFLYGGNSKINDVDIPFKTVFDNILDINNVNITPNIIIPNTDRVATNDCIPPAKYPPINIVAIQIKNGNLPLHGTKAFVKMDINFSLGESIILVPTTPAALQPSPIHIVNACFPRTTCFLKILI